MTARASIKDSLVTLFKDNLTTTNSNNIIGRMKFWDEINDYPFMCVVAGNEEREYLPSGFSWGYLNMKLWVYVYDEDTETELDSVFSEIEDLIDDNNDLEYEPGKYTTLMSLSGITTDEGILTPNGVGQITVTVQYALDRYL